SLKDGDRFTVCDAGGGTVDLIVFGVSELAPSQTRHLKEATRGHGAHLPAQFLDANMERLLERKFLPKRTNTVPVKLGMKSGSESRASRSLTLPERCGSYKRHYI
ncbi:MAG: hypothetical protein J3Q66DRAFT_282962, partial [Benniella sp.]